MLAESRLLVAQEHKNRFTCWKKPKTWMSHSTMETRVLILRKASATFCFAYFSESIYLVTSTQKNSRNAGWISGVAMENVCCLTGMKACMWWTFLPFILTSSWQIPEWFTCINVAFLTFPFEFHPKVPAISKTIAFCAGLPLIEPKGRRLPIKVVAFCRFADWKVAIVWLLSLIKTQGVCVRED